MPRTLRSKRLRNTLYASADGKCRICGIDLKHDWHADHVVPWSVTGRTNVHEMQALCPACNLSKGSRMADYRKHQEEMKDVASRMANSKRQFRLLCHVVCGGGKSWLPYILMSEMPPNVRLCWVVPRSALQEQAATEQDGNHGIQLRDSGNEIDPCRGYRGVVVTQQAFSLQPELWRDEFKRHPYILVVDEPHHAKVSHNGEKNALATAISLTEGHCFGVVYMTGTLTTGDNRMIYGVEYIDSVDGRGIEPCQSGFDACIRYSRSDAREDDAIVPIKFFHHDGPVKWESLRLGTEVEVRLSEATRTQESSAIWTALSTSMATDLFDRGYEHWKKYGESLLVLCNTQAKAKEYHRKLLELGEKSFLAVTENDDALNSIKQFKATKSGCLVTCAMAYEGLDHKQLSHVVCLTHIRSTPWIEQALARVWRKAPGKSQCFAFVPDDPRMSRVIREIKAEQPDVKRPSDSESSGGGDGGERQNDAIPIDSQHLDTRQTSLDEDVTASEFNDKQLQAIEMLRSVGLDDSHEAVQAVIGALSAVDKPSMNGGITPKQRESALRNKIVSICRNIDSLKDAEFGTMQKTLFRRNRKSIKDMNEKELRRALEYVENLLP